MDRRQRAVQRQSLTQLFECHIRFAAYQLPQLLAMKCHNLGLASGVTMPWSDITGSSALLQELFDQAQRNAVTTSNFFSIPLLFIVGSQNSFAQIQRNRSHEQTLSKRGTDGYSFI